MLHVHPAECLMDDYISIKITQLQPGQHITLRCETIAGKYVFDSHAYFVATLKGVVDVNTDPSFGGSYKGISQMGMFWSILPALGQIDGLVYVPYMSHCMDAMKYILQVYDGHVGEEHFEKSDLLTHRSKDVQHPIKEGVALMRYNGEGVTRHEVRHGRVRGTVFKPPGPGPFKGVIDMWKGAAGGINEPRGAILASHGYIAFTLPTHRYDDLVETVDEIEIEYILEAIEYFNSLGTVQPNIGIVGLSGSGTLALFLSTISPEISAVITYGSPYAFVIPYKYEGECVGSIFDSSASFIRRAFAERTLHVRGGYYSLGWLNHVPDEDLAIKIETSRSKFLIGAGSDDKSMNALKHGQYMVARMKKYGKGNQITLLSYPGAGHIIHIPFSPTSVHPFKENMAFAMGGDVIENSITSVHFWRETLQFLNANVGTSSKL